MSLSSARWEKEGIASYVHPIQWYDRDTTFEEKLDNLLNLVRDLSRSGPVSLAGVSAGASTALNAFLREPDLISSCICICGPVRFGDGKLCERERMKKRSPLFAQSVEMSEENIGKLHNGLESRILTIFPKFGDELIQRHTVKISGAKNIEIPVIGHRTGVLFAMTLWSKEILGFIKNHEPIAEI
ncbi:hypothetical protein JW710_04800 [Candidatus Dojkabacteria bacterium]|nr:hypothetical protein [Candidatus Dojkabacteria bacterium]